MNEMKTLFENRLTVGTMIENILDDRGITKKQLCEDAGISRPTLDRMIMGEISNMATFSKHLSKICNVLDITEDDLLYRRGRTRTIREKLHMNLAGISDIIDISEERLEEIENGAEASLAELRDIALCLGTSTRVLNNKEYFERTMMGLDSMFPDDDTDDGISAFWGHVGILPEGSKEYLWFPISGLTRKRIYHHMGYQRMVIPCMNNRLLLLNMHNIKSILLLDEACDEPSDANWDPEVSEGKIAPVVYEAIDDYFNGNANEDTMSADFRSYMDRIAEEYHWDDCTSITEIYRTEIHFKDGQVKENNIEFGRYENISEDIDFIYSWEDCEEYASVYHYSELSGEEHILNPESIAMLVMPLVSVEEAIINLE